MNYHMNGRTNEKQFLLITSHHQQINWYLFLRTFYKRSCPSLITLAGIIGSGKSSLTEILAQELGTRPFYEPVEDNPVLPLFYQGNEIAAKRRAAGEKNVSNPYAYLLQTFFLNRRFKMIKEAKKGSNNILDRSIYEDAMFMKMNTAMGNATEIEYSIYKELLANMLSELQYVSDDPTEDLMVMINVSYDTMIKRIKKRGREFEQVETDPSLVSYYHNLLDYYSDWANSYDISPFLLIDGDKYDFVENPADRNLVLDLIEEKLVALNKLSPARYSKLKQKRS
ncbi:Deoxyguanosine kinase [Ligilactobacillus acidipiscis DSM 15836]|uniref:Deoxyguanosine kinase n=1 Tax=Ligilactobacillus acidipiscis DSM 15836 TaxID=1423716 RepID=A0ABR5PL77_9LACO|nr:Deoxyguanosine kinase [Ligilactobacillus acidipiscis DSM 15836]